MLRGDEQFAVKRRFRGTPVERLGGGKVHEVGIVVGLRNVREHQKTRARVEALGGGKVFADNVIGQVPGAAHDALLDVPGIRPHFQHFQIVIRFENEAIGVAQMEFDEFRQIAEVSNDSDFAAVGAKRIAHGIRSIVRNGKGRNFDVADGEFFAGADVLDAIQFFRGAFGQEAEHLGESSLRKIGSCPEVAQKLGQSAGMIGVLVGNENGVNAIGIFVESGETAKRFFAAESGVNQEASALGFKQRGVAGAAGSENGNSKADRPSPAARFRRTMNRATCAA